MNILFAAAIFLGVACLVGGIVMATSGRRASVAEARLGTLDAPTATQGTAENPVGALAEAMKEETVAFQSLEDFASRIMNLRNFIEQSGVQIAPGTLGAVTPLALFVAPPLACTTGSIPFLWVFWKRRCRLKAFEKQFPEALELLARSLRAGHSLADGIHLVSDEMGEPIAGEFHRSYEQQQLGMPLEESLEDLAERIPQVDVRFFATAVVLQRQTGGDMAEILDKIGRLIRERFQIRGQIQALTGEGRLSGIVLLALPIGLGAYMYFKNPDYLMVLFEDPIGHKMVAGAIISQILGALCIKKIVSIKV
jgi:tight adherence protein B